MFIQHSCLYIVHTAQCVKPWSEYIYAKGTLKCCFRPATTGRPDCRLETPEVPLLRSAHPTKPVSMILVIVVVKVAAIITLTIVIVIVILIILVIVIGRELREAWTAEASR